MDIWVAKGGTKYQRLDLHLMDHGNADPELVAQYLANNDTMGKLNLFFAELVPL